MINEFSPLNLSDPELAKFVNNSARSLGDVIELDPSAEIQDFGYDKVGEKTAPGLIGKGLIFTAIRRHYRVLKGGQPIGDHYLTLPLITTVRLTRFAVLGLSQIGIPLDAKAAVATAFSSYDFAANGPLTLYVSKKLVEFNSLGGSQLTGEEFALFYRTRCEWIGNELDRRQEDWLMTVFKGDARALIPDLLTEGSNLQGLGYDIIKIGDEYLDTPPTEPQRYGDVPVPKGTLIDPSAVDSVVIDFARNAAQCDALEPLRERITSLNMPPEFMWKPDWVYYRNPCGGGFHFLAMQTYVKQDQSVLYAVATFPTLEKAFESIFLQSLKDAAAAGAVTAIVFSDFEAGVAIFKSEFKRLVKERTLRDVKCLIPELVLVRESGEWVKSEFRAK